MRHTLFFDIETAPNLSYVWGHYDQNVIKHVRPWYILCIAWKWQGQKKVHTKALCDYEDYEEDPHNDRELCRELWGLLDEAKVVVAHNGDKFDIRKSNARFSIHGLGAPSPYVTVDTLKAARRYFLYNTNRLDDVGQELGIGRKVKHEGFGLWEKCMAGDLAAWRRMKKYNVQDINLLVDFYEEIRPFMKTHPNMATITGRPEACSKCGVTGMMQSRGTRETATRVYRVFHCRACGGYPRERLADKDFPVPDLV